MKLDKDGWIAIKDRTPPEGQSFLVYRMPYIDVAEILYVEENGSINWLSNGVVFDDVTHWMELPKRPNKEQFKSHG